MRVLVVEDERDTAEALAWGLTAEGYVVDVAGNGVDGLWKATENAYDVIVLDVMLPGLDGYQVARRLREAGRWTPVLMLTAMDDDLDHAEGLDSGADDYPAQAVLLPGPARAPALADPPHARRPADGAGRGLLELGGVSAQLAVYRAVGGFQLQPVHHHQSQHHRRCEREAGHHGDPGADRAGLGRRTSRCQPAGGALTRPAPAVMPGPG